MRDKPQPRRRCWLAATLLGALALAAAGASGAGGSTSRRTVLLPPPHHRIYHAAFPGFGGPENQVSARRVRSFERAAGRSIAWAYFSNNWFHRTIRFPLHNVETIAHTGAVPFIRMMPRSSWRSGPDRNYTLASIAAGRWDEIPSGGGVVPWCESAAAYGRPLLVEFGTEVNNGYFPWSGRFNGGGGDSNGDGHADGAERFVGAYRHIVDVCRGEGAANISWFFHVDVGTSPHRPWNRMASYYPGDRYVDWIGFSDYGPTAPGERWVSFRRRLDRVYPQLAGLSAKKPIAALEFGAANDPSHRARQARWIARALGAIATRRWPRLRAISYWNETWRNGDGSISELRIDSSPRTKRAYRRAVARPIFTSGARFVRR